MGGDYNPLKFLRYPYVFLKFIYSFEMKNII